MSDVAVGLLEQAACIIEAHGWGTNPKPESGDSKRCVQQALAEAAGGDVELWQSDNIVDAGTVGTAGDRRIAVDALKRVCRTPEPWVWNDMCCASTTEAAAKLREAAALVTA